MSTYPVQTQSFILGAQGGIAGGTTLPLQSFKDILGNALSMSAFGDIGYATIEPNTSNEDSISFTGITQNTDGTAILTGVNSLGFFTPFTASTGLRISHAGSVTFIITNTSAFYNNFANKQNAEVITKNWSVPDPVGMTDIANKGYVLSVVNGGAVSVASVIVAGTADTTVVAGQVLYLKSNGRWALADASTAATVYGVQLGIAQGSGTSGVTITGGVLIEGVDTHQSGLVAGTSYYVRNGGGLPSSSAGTFARLIGLGDTATAIYFGPNADSIATEQVSTTSRANAVPQANSSGFLSQGFIQNIITAGVDQSQTTSNSTQKVGESNATGKQFLLAQSFIPVNPSIQGVSLWKIADSGSFTGTMKVALQADSAGSPSGVDLASYTISNAVWLKIPAAGEFTVAFSTEYESMVVGNLYWIVVTPSTNDNTNHPNLGANSAGGYANGTAKYQNAIDSWVAIASVDLYFKTNEGVLTKLVQTDATSGLPAANVRPYSLVDMSIAAVSVTGTTSETVAYSKMLTGGFFSLNSGLKISSLISLGESAAVGSMVLRVKFNGTTIASFTSPGVSNANNTINSYVMPFDIFIINNNSLSSQNWGLNALFNPAGFNLVSGSPNYAAQASTANGTSAVDTSNPVLLEITIQLGASGLAAGFNTLLIEKIG